MSLQISRVLWNFAVDFMDDLIIRGLFFCLVTFSQMMSCITYIYNFCFLYSNQFFLSSDGTIFLQENY
jgi:hypothetical protein